MCTATVTFVTTITNNDARDAQDLALSAGTSPTISSFSISFSAGTAS